jgi:hypothetical protein
MTLTRIIRLLLPLIGIAAIVAGLLVGSISAGAASGRGLTEIEGPTSTSTQTTSTSASTTIIITTTSSTSSSPPNTFAECQSLLEGPQKGFTKTVDKITVNSNGTVTLQITVAGPNGSVPSGEDQHVFDCVWLSPNNVPTTLVGSNGPPPGTNCGPGGMDVGLPCTFTVTTSVAIPPGSTLCDIAKDEGSGFGKTLSGSRTPTVCVTVPTTSTTTSTTTTTTSPTGGVLPQQASQLPETGQGGTADMALANKLMAGGAILLLLALMLESVRFARARGWYGTRK